MFNPRHPELVSGSKPKTPSFAFAAWMLKQVQHDIIDKGKP
jgi:hypothetical protein